VIWGVLASAMGARCIPTSFWQAMAWFHSYAPGFEKFYVVIITTVCWVIWNVKNKITFKKHVLRSPNEITYFDGALIVYWAGLQKADDKKSLIGGAEKMVQAASSIYTRRTTATPN
jgi:hypothetical protein